MGQQAPTLASTGQNLGQLGQQMGQQAPTLASTGQNLGQLGQQMGQQAPTLASTGMNLNQVGHGQQSGMGNLQSLLGQFNQQQPPQMQQLPAYAQPYMQQMQQQAQMGGQQPQGMEAASPFLQQQMGPDRQRQFGQQQALYDEHRGLDRFFGQQPSMGGQQLGQLGNINQLSQQQTPTAGVSLDDHLAFQQERERQIHADPSSPFHSMYHKQPEIPSWAKATMSPQQLQQTQQKMALPQRQQMMDTPLLNSRASVQQLQQRRQQQQPAPRPMPPSRPNTQQVRPEDARMQSMRGIQQLASRFGRSG
jgi:hypothetical protein